MLVDLPYVDHPGLLLMDFELAASNMKPVVRCEAAGSVLACRRHSAAKDLIVGMEHVKFGAA